MGHNLCLDLFGGPSAEEAAAASPLLRLGALPPMAPLMPLLAAVGGDETDGFKQWTADLAIAWRAHGAPATLLEIAGQSHFTILDALAEDEGDIPCAIRRLAGR